jgi:23S rRNA (adenine2503-C2)-methyltransferase
MNLLSLTYAELTELFRQRYAKGGYHAAALYRSFFDSGPADWKRLPAFAASARLVGQIERDLLYRPLTIVRRETREGVTKLAFRLDDGLAVETVIIPMARHTTVCISCQVGCRMGCRLCETGQMGLRRQLSAAEIVAQVFAVKIELGFDVRNVVFMGMGEPLDNFDNVIQAIRVLGEQRGLNIAPRRITVSTAGIVEGIERLAQLNWPLLKLAVSLNAADDDLRTTLMPINARSGGLAALKQVLARYPLARGNVLLVEYVLIKGFNDQAQHVHQLAAFLEGLTARLNLIPYNPRRNSPYVAPDDADVIRFQQALIERGIFVRLRKSKGAEIRAACGQLGSLLDPRGV